MDLVIIVISIVVVVVVIVTVWCWAFASLLLLVQKIVIIIIIVVASVFVSLYLTPSQFFISANADPSDAIANFPKFSAGWNEYRIILPGNDGAVFSRVNLRQLQHSSNINVLASCFSYPSEQFMLQSLSL